LLLHVATRADEQRLGVARLVAEFLGARSDERRDVDVAAVVKVAVRVGLCRELFAQKVFSFEEGAALEEIDVVVLGEGVLGEGGHDGSRGRSVAQIQILDMRTVVVLTGTVPPELSSHLTPPSYFVGERKGSLINKSKSRESRVESQEMRSQDLVGTVPGGTGSTTVWYSRYLYCIIQYY
jgi:hypothetical protein